ncbi:H-2 class II histocompatibility antigen, E-S beta chain-like [Emys orbicularis]|uniref:H-2 class II histocompatibility antigen, E-S beta chain-like n=1 Tax=Emys orbicularis TaxID=82168 RepID=UPI0031FBEE07
MGITLGVVAVAAVAAVLLWNRHRKFPAPLPVQPKVKVSPLKSGSQPHPKMLVCSITGFHSSGTEIKQSKTGKAQMEKMVSTELLQNGDWTFQILVMLEMSPQRGDVYTCQVEHISLRDPLTVHWEAQSDSARSKMLTGVGGFLLGLIFLAPGLRIYPKTEERVFPPATKSNSRRDSPVVLLEGAKSAGEEKVPGFAPVRCVHCA